LVNLPRTFEINIETLGHEPNTLYLTHHWIVDGFDHYVQEKYIGPDFSADYHTLSVAWTTRKIKWSIDGIERFRSVSNIPNVPLLVLFQLSIGGKWSGEPDAMTVFPGYFDVDWIRIR